MNIVMINHYINEVFIYTLAGFPVTFLQLDTCVVESAKQNKLEREKPKINDGWMS